MGKRNLIFIAALFIVQLSVAQKQVMCDQQVWFGYNSQSRITNKLGIWLDGNLRTRKDFFTNFYQSVVRIGLMYYLDNDVRVTAGYAWINYFPFNVRVVLLTIRDDPATKTTASETASTGTVTNTWRTTAT